MSEQAKSDEDKAQEVRNYLAQTIRRHELDQAVMAECTCGGGGPDDKKTCPACRVWHRLIK